MTTSSVGSAIKAFRSRSDLARYGDNALLLYALELRHNIDDIHAVAAESLTDGADDKKCDLVYIDRDRRLAVIAQGYVSSKPRHAAPANKASDLNTAGSWLLSANRSELPTAIRSAAKELRSALNDNEIEVMELWYVHNCPNSTNVERELATVQNGVKALLSASFKNSKCSEVRATEIGVETLEEWYRATGTAILVADTFRVEVPGGYRTKVSAWDAYATAVPARWLYELYAEHKTNLFSANVRDYLGSRKSDSNINHGIKESVAERPENFWAFNNGITALVNDFSAEKGSLSLTGISIVNGAQTTGAIGSLDAIPHSSALVPARFIKCSDPELIQDIIRFNNSQNKVAPADFRSTDAVQERLRQEFGDRIPSIVYLGGRRGGSDDAIRRKTDNHIPSDTAAQSLTAFHQNPGLAYARKGDIWESDQHYSRVFNEKTHAEHILFVYSLFATLSEQKLDLVTKNKQGDAVLAETEQQTLSFFRQRGAIHVMMAAMSACMEMILGRTVASKFDLRFSKQVNIDQAKTLWSPVAQCCVPFHSTLARLFEQSAPAGGDIAPSINQFRSLVEATKVSNAAIYGNFALSVSSGTWATSAKARARR